MSLLYGIIRIHINAIHILWPCTGASHTIYSQILNSQQPVTFVWSKHCILSNDYFKSMPLFSRYVLLVPVSPFLIVNDFISYFVQNNPLLHPSTYFFIFLHNSYIEHLSSFQKPFPNLWILSTPAFSRTIHCYLYFFHLIYSVILSQMNPSHWNLNMFKSHYEKNKRLFWAHISTQVITLSPIPALWTKPLFSISIFLFPIHSSYMLIWFFHSVISPKQPSWRSLMIASC